jgi:hypothetical protein
MTARRLLLCALVSAAAACGSGQNGTVAPPDDAGTDLGPADTGPLDASTDTGPADTGPADTGPADSGSADSGPTDTGPADVALPGCGSDEACAADGGAMTRCDPQSRQCVQCVTNDHCAAGSLCVGNVCVMGCTTERPCPAAQSCCDGACVELQSNVAACGACGNRCSVANAAAACVNGACTVGMCNAPFGDCDGNATNGCETNTQTAPAHCGACGMACAARPNSAAECAAGACRYTCAAGFGDCDNDPSNGCEARLDTPERCGACTTRCDLANATAACTMGRCAVNACTAGFGDCDGNATNGCETDTRRSDAHCGACGTQCQGGDNAVPVCVTGRCALTCTAGFADCDGMAANGCEVNTTTAASHCGGCGRTCALPNTATATCAASLCAVGTCAAGFGDCDAMASNGCEANLNTAVAHCGACGRSCAAGQNCAAGACVGADGPLTVPVGTTRNFSDLTVASTVQSVSGAEIAATEAMRFRVGDEVLLINLQSTTADVSAVGVREFVRVTAVTAGRLVVQPAPAAQYAPGGNGSLAGQRVFAVRVPHFTTVTLDGTLTATAWDGTAAGLGLVVMRASEAIRVGAQGAVDVSGRGYDSDSAMCNGVWGRPGESLAPRPPLATGECHYANPSNTPNVGGGAGGQSNCNTYACGTQLLGAGGGGAGYGTAGAPGANNGSLHVGGRGGGTYGEPALGRWFLGSGGGAGAGGTSGPGMVNRAGRGGGLVFLSAPTLAVAGRVASDGQTGGNNANCGGTQGSGSGGGGAGGTVVLEGAAVTLGTVTARGGAGGCLGGGAGGVGRVRVGYGTLNGAAFPGGNAALTTPPAHLDDRR